MVDISSVISLHSHMRKRFTKVLFKSQVASVATTATTMTNTAFHVFHFRAVLEGSHSAMNISLRLTIPCHSIKPLIKRFIGKEMNKNNKTFP